MFKPTVSVWQPSEPLFKMTILGSLMTALGLAGCSTTPSNSGTQVKSQHLKQQSLDVNSMDNMAELLSATDMRAVEGDRLLILKHGDVWKRMTVGFKMNLNYSDSRIEAQRGWFISRQPYIDRLSARASRYLYYTVKEAERRGMPTELALLPIVESSYDPAVTSSAAAAGMWQFIPSTGKIYGLQQTSLYDGRRDVAESTRAAYEFLGSLYNQFGSWELALAAYNAGPGRVQQAINRNKAAGLATDFWSLKLPQETMNYVPRFIAVAQIIKNPTEYGVRLPPIANRPHFREVFVGAVNLNDVAGITGLSRAELYQLNPGHRGDWIDEQSPMRVLIPADLSPTIDTHLKALAVNREGALLANAQLPKSSNNTQTALNTTPVASPPSSAELSAAARQQTPEGANALASFAMQTDIPSAPRVPVAVTQAVNITPVALEPALTTAEREQIVAAVRVEGQNKVDALLKPVASRAEQDAIVAELQKLAPAGTEIIDPADGKIRLTAIQTSLSVADQRGQELTKGFSYPKAVADQTKPDSLEAKLNQGKTVIQTGSEVTVIQPKGKRSSYSVLQGDTLLGIAMKNGVNWRDVAAWNQMEPEATLFAGTTIYLYDAKPIVSNPTPASIPDKYIVQSNDTLSGVAAQFSMSLKQLAEYNDIDMQSNIFVGQTLSLKPQQSKATTNSNTASVSKIKTDSYSVKRGENLSQIAERYDLSNSELAQLNANLTANSALQAGQKINVPAKAIATKVITLTQNQASNTLTKTQEYTVQRGDTLSSIANDLKLSMAELIRLNELTGNMNLQDAQVLTIPLVTVKALDYTVKSGDTLSVIAERYKLKTEYLASLNGLTQNANIRVGQTLKLDATAVKAVEKQELADSDYATYVVKSGETLSSIAKKYYLQQDYLAKLNDLQGNARLKVGQRLKVNTDALTKKVEPVSVKEPAKTVTATKTQSTDKTNSAKTESYTVKSGDSLNAIAARLGISTIELATLNNLRANAGLKAGQSLTIPKKFSEYRVKRGDTLIGLASRYDLPSQDLAELNELSPGATLKIGQTLQVPN